MLSFTWHLLKAFRYLLPYLNEVSDERYCVDDNDRLRAKRIRELIRMILWRLIFFIIFTGLIFWVVMPLHARNAVLQQELTNRDNKITVLQTEMRDLRGTIRKTERDLDRFKLSYENKTVEAERLTDSLRECKDFGSKILSMTRVSENPNKTPVAGKNTNSNNNKVTPPAIQQPPTTVSEDLKNKIKKYNEK